MGTRSSTLAIRLVILISIWLLGTATFSLAQDGTTTSPVQGDETATTDTPTATETTAETDEATDEATGETAEEAGPLVVPDVLQLPYVFAKGVLEDAGFSWKVKGKVQGYAVNYVVEQSVAPLTSVVDTGAPTIILKLAKNPAYEERGIPDNVAPFKGTPVVLENGGEPEAATAEAPVSDTGESDSSSTKKSASTDSASEAPEAYPSTIE